MNRSVKSYVSGLSAALRPLMLSALGLTACAVAFPTPANAAIEGTWTRHYTFNRLVSSFAPSPDRLFMLVHPQEYTATSREDIATLAASVFYMDDPSAPIRSLSDFAPLSGGVVRVMRYNPAGGYLFLGYDDGKIDMVYPDGTCREAPGLSLFSFPGSRKLRDVSFSPEGDFAYVATDFGYIKVNSSDGSSEIVNLSTPFRAVAPAGTSVMALRPDGVLLEGHASDRSADAFIPVVPDASSDPLLVQSNGEMYAPLNILPLSDDAFCYLASVAGGKTSLALAVRRSGKWHLINLEQDSFRLHSAGQTVNTAADNNGAPNRDGYYFHSGNLAYQVRRNVDFSLPDDELRKQAVAHINKSEDANKESASWDMTQYWFYNDRSGIYTRSMADGKWLDRTEVVAPKLALAHISDEIAWHPTRGLILQNHGVSYDFPDTRANVPSSLCGLKNGVWTNYSPMWNRPRFMDTNSTLASQYNNTFTQYPLIYPSGVELDPDNPDYVYSGSMKGGMARFDLGDPCGNILHMTHPADPSAKRGYPGYVQVCETMSWAEHCSFTTPRFDGHGNLWSLYFDYNRFRSGAPVATLRVWTREDRLASEKANDDPSLFRQWHTLVYPDFTNSNYEQMIALRNEVNDNIIVAASNNFQDPIYVIDHRGTLTDTSDDRIARITNITDAEGAGLLKDHVYFMKEDPSTGMVWVGTDSGLFYFSPAAAFRQPGLVMRPRAYDERKGCESVFLEGVLVRDMSIDNQGRKWFATLGAGVTCLSADNRIVEGTWTTENSALPSDNLYAVGCDLADGNVLVSTDAGLAEFIPAGSPRQVPGATPKVYPSRVEPGFEGMIEARNLPAATSYAIVDAAGKILRELAAPADGILRWDALASDGRRCPTGRYYITPLSDTSIRHAEIIILGN